jgi:hypothetical protein
MFQFYFLSVSCNLLAGLALAFEAVSRRLPRLSGLSDLLTSRGSKIFLGIAVLLTGFVTLFVPAGEGIIIGDLIPSLAGIALGIALLFEVFRQEAVFPSERTERMERPLGAYRTTIGLLGMAAAILHFFLPDKPFF